MILGTEQQKENRFVIVRTKKGSTVNYFSFCTVGFNTDQPKQQSTLLKPSKVAEKVEFTFNGNNDLIVFLEMKRGSFKIIEQVIIQGELIESIKVFTDFESLRDRRESHE